MIIAVEYELNSFTPLFCACITFIADNMIQILFLQLHFISPFVDKRLTASADF